MGTRVLQPPTPPEPQTPRKRVISSDNSSPTKKPRNFQSNSPSKEISMESMETSTETSMSKFLSKPPFNSPSESSSKPLIMDDELDFHQFEFLKGMSPEEILKIFPEFCFWSDEKTVNYFEENDPDYGNVEALPEDFVEELLRQAEECCLADEEGS